MKTSLLLLFVILVSASTAFGQTAPVFSHFYANPFQFNPAYAASNGYTEANLFYRKQWFNIDNAPTTLAFNIQAPVGRNVSLGLTAISDQTILLNTNTVYGTFGYRVRFNPQHHLNFGISGGIGFNTFDFEAIGEANDPALIGVIDNNSFLAGQFGVYYQFKNLSLGFALPKLFDSRPNSLEEFNEIEFNKFKNKFASLSYTINLGDVQLTPTALYRTHDDREDQIEGMVIASYKNIFWIGSSYRNEYGLTGFVGINVKKLLRIGYAYEYPTGDISKVAGGTHEVYMGGRLGKKNREELIAMEEDEQPQEIEETDVATVEEPEEIETPQEEEVQETEEPVVITQQEPLQQITPPTEEQSPSPTLEPNTVQEQEKEATTPPVETSEPYITNQPVETSQPDNKPSAELSGYYVVVGVFSNIDNALKQMAVLKRDGKSPAMLYRADKDYYYVYTFFSKTREETLRQLNIIRRENKHFGAWMYTLQE